MNCPSCHHANPSDAHFCANCGVQVVAHTGDNAAIADLVNGVHDDATSDAPSSATTTTPGAASHDRARADSGIPATTSYDTAPLDDRNSLTTTAPHGVGAGAPARQATSGADSLVAGRTSSILPIVLTVAVVAAIVVMGAVLVLSGGGDDSVASVTTDDVTRSTDFSSSTAPPAVDPTVPAAPATIPVPATDVPAATTAPETVPPATAAPTTAVPPSTNPAAVPPVPPEPGPINAPGSPQVLANVSPSGLPFNETATAFAVAQEFGDALALQDWDLARALSPDLADNSDDDFALGYANTNRVSLILVDARRAGTEIELLVVSVAVELGGAQTSLYCLQWNVDPNARTVNQDGGSRIAQWPVNAQPEAIRNDPQALATVNQCGWP